MSCTTLSFSTRSLKAPAFASELSMGHFFLGQGDDVGFAPGWSGCWMLRLEV